MEWSDQLQPLRQCYEEYLEERQMILQDGGPFQGVARLFTGPPAGERMSAKRFIQRLEECLAQLDREDAGLVAQAVEYMLLEAEGTDQNSKLMFQAAESCALPLLDALAREDAARLLKGYIKRYPKRRQLLPKQREVMAGLSRAAK